MLSLSVMQAERNRNMGQRQRQLKAELERREKEAVNGIASSGGGAGGGGLGAGGEARVAAAKLDELRKQGDALREEQSRARSAAVDTARASASKKRRTSLDSSGLFGSSGSNGYYSEDQDQEERTVAVKWSIKKESHSDHTLDVLFSRFGAVEAVTIEEGKGNRAHVMFTSAASADAAVAAFRDGVTLRASYIGKRRPKRSAFAPRRQTMSPMPQHRHANGNEGAAAADGTTTFRDQESLVMMRLRQMAERQALMRRMTKEANPEVDLAEDESGIVNNNGRGRGSIGGSSRRKHDQADVGDNNSGSVGARKEASEESDGQTTGEKTAATQKFVLGKASDRPSAATAAAVDASDGVSGIKLKPEAGAGWGAPGRAAKPAFPVPSPFAARVVPSDGGASRRESDILSAMMRGGSGTNGGVVESKGRVFSGGVSTGGSKSMPTTPVGGGKSAGAGAIDENDVLARMMMMAAAAKR